MSKPIYAAIAALCLSALSLPAHAILYGGNPKLLISFDRAEHDLVGGEATLHRAVLNGCPGAGPAITVDQSFDPVEGLEVAIPAGDWCTVTLEWGDTALVEGESWTLESDATSTTVPLSTGLANLSPFVVIEGILYGGNPKVVVEVQ